MGVNQNNDAAPVDIPDSKSFPKDIEAPIVPATKQGNAEQSDNVSDSSEHDALLGWKRPVHVRSMAEAHASIPVPDENASFWRKLWAFAGVGLMVSIGYMDPGNWATDLAGGSQFGYTLLVVIFLSNLAAMFLQHLALKLGVAAERDLAQVCTSSAQPGCLNSVPVCCTLAPPAAHVPHPAVPSCGSMHYLLSTDDMDSRVQAALSASTHHLPATIAQHLVWPIHHTR